HSKCGIRVTVSGVRIPPSPPTPSFATVRPPSPLLTNKPVFSGAPGHAHAHAGARVPTEWRPYKLRLERPILMPAAPNRDDSSAAAAMGCDPCSESYASCTGDDDPNSATCLITFRSGEHAKPFGQIRRCHVIRLLLERHTGTLQRPHDQGNAS